MSSTIRRLTVAALATLAAAACADSPTGASASAPRGVVVLNGFGQPGLTLLADTGSASSRIDFGPSFDGGGMTLARDTVVATSSKGGGDLLYVADLRTASLLKVQMPAKSNPGGAAFLGGTLGIGVALRDSGAVALVRPSGTAAPSITYLRGVGRCPYDVDAHGGSVWVLDANLDCRATYAPLGSARLVRVSPDGAGARDTVVLTGIENATSLTVVGDFAYVTSAGVADFSKYPITLFTAPGTVTRVDLARKQVTRTVSLPQGSYGAGLRVGQDGMLYVTAYTSTDFASKDVFSLTPTLDYQGLRAAGKQSLSLVRADGTPAVCAAATADARGRVHCVANGTASAATLYVFGTDGREVRRVAAGQGAVDVGLR